MNQARPADDAEDVEDKEGKDVVQERDEESNCLEEADRESPESNRANEQFTIKIITKHEAAPTKEEDEDQNSKNESRRSNEEGQGNQFSPQKASNEG